MVSCTVITFPKEGGRSGGLREGRGRGERNGKKEGARKATELQ
jgi:hypothetical protein